MRAKASKQLAILAVVFCLSFISLQAMADPISDQIDLQDMLSQNTSNIALLFDADQVNVTVPWNSAINTNITDITVETGSNGVRINLDPNSHSRFFSLNSGSYLTVSLTESSSLIIDGFKESIVSSNSPIEFGGAIKADITFMMLGGNINFSNNSVKSTSNYNGNSKTQGNAEARGGAIYSEKELRLFADTYTFSGNLAISVPSAIEALSMGTGTSAGGAIAAVRSAEFAGDTYYFSDNTAKAYGFAKGFDGQENGNDYVGKSYAYGGALAFVDCTSLVFSAKNYHFVSNNAISESSSDKATYGVSYGGAIYCGSQTVLNLLGTTFEFKNNEAMATAYNLTYKMGHAAAIGGAIYAIENINFIDGIYSFIGNIARANGYGGNGAGGYGNTLSCGGALASQSKITFENGDYLFKENSALSSAFVGNSLAVAEGGALYSFGGIEILAGTYKFIDNRTYSYDECRYIRLDNVFGGGAIYSDKYIMLDGGAYVFIGNKAETEGSSLACGGAIFANHGLYVHGGTFENNSASNYGGAIYINSKGILRFSSPLTTGSLLKSTDPDSYVVLKASIGHSMLFDGNKQFTNSSSEANSVYFGGDGIIHATVEVEANALFLMKDPISSNYLGQLFLEKKDLGTWQLGGSSVLNKETQFSVKEGTLRMLPGSTLHIEMTGSLFEVFQGGYLQGTIGDEKSTITANSVSLNGGKVGVELVETYYTSSDLALSPDNSYVVLQLETLNGTIGAGNNLVLDPAMNQGSKEFVYGLNIYSYSEIDWEAVNSTYDDNTKWQLIIKGIKLKEKDRNRLGAYALAIPGRTGLSDSFGTLFDRSEDILNKNELSSKYVWFDTSAENTKIFDANMKIFRFTAGLEKVANYLHMGVAAKTSVYIYEGFNVTGIAVNPHIYLYIGHKLRYDITLSASIGYGLNIISQTRYVKDDILNSLYPSHILTGSFGLSKRIDLGDFLMTPVVYYEFYGIYTKAYTETSKTLSPEKSFALKFGDSIQQTHRVSMGTKASYNVNNIEFEMKALYIINLGDITATAKNGLVNDPRSDLYDVENKVSDRSSVNLGLKISTYTQKDTLIFIEYNGLFSKNINSHALKLSLSVKI